MLKLYKLTSDDKKYWETWSNDDGTHTVHWGALGTEGQSKIVKGSFLRTPDEIIQKEYKRFVSLGYAEPSHNYTLLIEYKLLALNSSDDRIKRSRLVERMNETLGWTGLGRCEGGSIANGNMQIRNQVVDFNIAKEVVKQDLKVSDFSDYTRIYCEELIETTP